MLLRRVNQADPVRRLRSEMDELFGNFFEEFPLSAVWGRNPAGFGEFGGGFPALNLSEDEKNLYAEVEVPGMKMDDLEVSVLGDQLTVKGKVEQASESGDKVTWHRRERRSGSFSRAVTLPVEIDADKVHAELNHGILKVSMPRAASVLPKRIEVKQVE